MPIRWNPTNWIGDLIEQRMNTAGVAMVGVAKALVAVDTGALQKSIGYRYDKSTKTLTLYALEHYAVPQEFGTYKMPPHPYLRPAVNAAGPAFLTGKLTGATVGVSLGTSLSPTHKPRLIKPNIRPHIAAANMMHNVGAAARAEFTAIHMNRKSEPIMYTKGFSKTQRVLTSSLSSHRLNRIRKAWN